MPLHHLGARPQTALGVALGQHEAPSPHHLHALGVPDVRVEPAQALLALLRIHVVHLVQRVRPASVLSAAHLEGHAPALELVLGGILLGPHGHREGAVRGGAPAQVPLDARDSCVCALPQPLREQALQQLHVAGPRLPMAAKRCIAAFLMRFRAQIQ